MPDKPSPEPLRVAVVGGGVAGITAAYGIQHIHRVTLFEKNDYVGGHTRTVTIPAGPDAGTPVDTGFIVLNDRTYPVLNRFFRRLGVRLGATDMSFGFCEPSSGFAYATRNADCLFARRRSLADPAHWYMLAEILRFNRLVERLLQRGALGELTLGGFLERFRFTARFRERYLFPMVAAIWSAPDVAVDRFPMATFARFFHNHGLLTIFRHPRWYYVSGGSHTYVRAFLDQFPGEVRTATAVRAIARGASGVTLTDAHGRTHAFDRVIVAAHADEAYRLLADPSDQERRLLSVWRYSTNPTYLHTDLSWMPPNRRAWASWNIVRGPRSDAGNPVTLTYHMNRLQRLTTRAHYLVTLNPFRPIPEEQIVARMVYTHPVYSFESLATQRDLPALNGVRRTFYCGSYFGYGFHEDGARSGLQVARALGAEHEF